MPPWERTRQFRTYESVVIPGLFQTKAPPPITQPREIAVYARSCADLSAMAVVGAPARRLITDAITSLKR